MFGLEARRPSVKAFSKCISYKGGDGLSKTFSIKIEDLALEIVERLCALCKNDDYKRSFRARARSLITDLYVNGISYVVTICAARSSANAVELGLTSKTPDDFIRVYVNERLAKKMGLKKSESYGYAIYGASLLYALRMLNIIKSTKLSDAIRELMNNSLADRKAYQFVVWLKRFAEAYIYE